MSEAEGYATERVNRALGEANRFDAVLAEYKTVPEGNTVLQSSPITPGEGEAGRTRTGDLAAYWWLERTAAMLR